MIFGALAAAVIFIGISMTDTKESQSLQTLAQEKPKDGSVFGTSSIINDISNQEATEMVDQMAQSYERNKENLRREKLDMDRRNEAITKRMGSLEQKLFEQNQQMTALMRGEGSVSPRKMPTNNSSQVAKAKQSNPNELGGQRYSNSITPTQSQIITPGPTAGSPIIRTVTQRSVRTLRNGEFTQQALKINTITSRGSGERVEPVRPELRAPLDKWEEEGQELFTLSMGSIISGTLLNGVAAPTSSDRKDNPMPVLMRIKREAIMPNGFSLDIIDCHMLGSAIGDLSQSRALIRAESIACNTHTGEAIEQRIVAYAVDSSDGMAGVSGDVVFKSGALIANSMKANFISAFANAFSPNKVQSLNTAPNATELWQTQNLDRAAGAGIGKGIGGAADRIAEYYMTLAEEAHPVIELLPGIEVDFIVQKGMTLRLGGREAPYTNNKMNARDSSSPLTLRSDQEGTPPIPSVNISLN